MFPAMKCDTQGWKHCVSVATVTFIGHSELRRPYTANPLARSVSELAHR